jgi:hypothetical protein
MAIPFHIGLTQKAALACGSMVFYLLLLVIFRPQGENNQQRARNLRRA